MIIELKLFQLGEGDVRATAFERVEQALLGGPVHAVGERIVCTTLQRVQDAAPLPHNRVDRGGRQRTGQRIAMGFDEGLDRRIIPALQTQCGYGFA